MLTPTDVPVDSAALEADLRANVRGEVRFDAGSRALYATDASNYRQVPIGVVVPRDIDDAVEAVSVCHRHRAPIVSRGGGTSLAGQSCNVAVVLDFSKYVNRIVELNPDERYAIVEPGIVLDVLRNAAEEHHLTFGPDPATHDHCTIGGMLGNNSCGVHSVMAGRTADNVEALEVLTYDGFRTWLGPTTDAELQEVVAEGGRKGQIYGDLRAIRDREADNIRRCFPDIPRRVSGYNLDELLPEKGFNLARALVGTEGTCVVVLRAKLRLVPSPPVRALVAVGYSDVFAAADDVPAVLESEPIGLEGLDEGLISDMRVKHLHPDDVDVLPAGRGWLLAEFGGETRDEAHAAAGRLLDRLQQRENPPATKVFDDREEEQQVWQIRESGLAATAHVPGKASTWPGWEDSAVDPARLGDYLREFSELLKHYGYQGDLYGHFGQGCLHTRITFDLVSEPGIDRWREFLVKATELVVKHGGSISGEHGDGQARAELLPLMYGDELIRAFAEFKRAWDPDWKMNPGKVVHPNAIDQNLRIGADYEPWQPRTQFSYPDDDGNFPDVALRCVGVGKCRRQDHGVMCPSYMVTRDERHSTRGRARMLFEMMEGDVITDGWRSDEVRESLDLCLACKGCKSDCPINVDMATYKAEFLSHYYAHRVRPRVAYSMGLIYWWARLASHMPRAVNFVAEHKSLGRVAKWLGGISQERSLPRFAEEPFTRWYERRGTRNPEGRRVLLWPDTFTNYLYPGAAKAAVRILENAGLRVDLPGKPLCCGRPLYDFGMVDTGKRLWRQTIDHLREDIRAGTPLVGLEPSCVAAFRDELINLFPHDPDARRLSNQTLMLSEFLTQWVDGFTAPTLAKKAIVQVHCHHHAAIGFEAERRLLDMLGLDYDVPDSGCCGMAGSFGFEAGEKYEVSLAAGERVILPQIREADPDTLIIANGFSCREQIVQATGRRAHHIGEVLAMALDEVEPGQTEPIQESPSRRSGRQQSAIGLLGGAAVLGVAAGALRRRRKG